MVRVWLQTRKMPRSGREPSPVARHQQRFVADGKVAARPARLEPDVQEQLAAVRQQHVPRVHLLLGADGRVRRDAHTVADADRAWLDPQALQHRQRARLDLPDDAIGAHAEVGVRIAPQHVRDLALELDERQRVEAAEEAVVRGGCARQRGKGEQAGSGAAHRRSPQFGLRKMKNAWSVVPRVPGANTIFVRSSAGFASKSLSSASSKPAASTSCLIVSTPMR